VKEERVESNGVGQVLEKVNGQQRDENGKGAQRWEGWGKIR